jgi:hypothetical protein
MNAPISQQPIFERLAEQMEGDQPLYLFYGRGPIYNFFFFFFFFSYLGGDHGKWRGTNLCIFFMGGDQYTIFFFFFFFSYLGGTRAPTGPLLPPSLHIFKFFIFILFPTTQHIVNVDYLPNENNFYKNLA